MKSVYESIMTGLNEAIEDAQSEGKKLNRRTVTIIPVKEYGAEQVRNIRNSVGMSQSTFAGYLGVTKKTVEAWEAGTNHPSGAASRILNMMEMDTELVEKYPFSVEFDKGNIQIYCCNGESVCSQHEYIAQSTGRCRKIPWKIIIILQKVMHIVQTQK